MPRNTSMVDWESWKSEIIRLVSAGKTRKDVLEALSKDGLSITKSQLEYQLKCWGQRINLTEQAWRYASHKVRKRTRNKQHSAVFFNGALIPAAKVRKETKRHHRPTLLPSPGTSPICPEGFDLVICTPPSAAGYPFRGVSPETRHTTFGPTMTTSPMPWTKFVHALRKDFAPALMDSNVDLRGWTNINFLKLSHFPTALIDSCKMQKSPQAVDVEQLERPLMALVSGPDIDQTVGPESAHRREVLCEQQVIASLGIHMFQISNKLSTGSHRHKKAHLLQLADALKTVARVSPSWEDLLTAGAGATSRSVAEELFKFSIISHDMELAEMMLQVGVDPNQRIYDEDFRVCISALDFALGRKAKRITNLLLSSGAVYGQTSLRHAVIAGDFNIAERMLESNPFLDLNFNYLDHLDQPTISSLRHLKLDTANLLGLACLHGGSQSCGCVNKILANNEHASGCPRYDSIASLEYLLRRKVAINLDTMIMASFRGDVVALRHLLQHGGCVSGFNRFGISCLGAACLNRRLDYDVFSLLLSAGATVNMPHTHHAFGSQPSAIQRLFTRHGSHTAYELPQIVTLLISAGADINYRIRCLGSPSGLEETYQKFLWSQSSHRATSADCIELAKAETLLEYAIISGDEDIALSLVSQGCQLTGREITLAVKAGQLSLLKVLLVHEGDHLRDVGRTCLQLALRWSHESIVLYLLEKGVELGSQDVIHAMQYPGISTLAANLQIELIGKTPDPERMQIFGISLLELCSLKFRGDAVRYLLRRFPTAYDSGALAAIVLRALKYDPFGEHGFHPTDIETMISRRTGNKCDWEKENAALVVATLFKRPDVLRVLVHPGTSYGKRIARVPKEHFCWFLDPHYPLSLYEYIDPTHSLGCKDWVACSPLVGIAAMRDSPYSWSVSDVMLDHLLDCSYGADALTVVIAAAQGNLSLLWRLQDLDNWQDILSIDNHDRPPWCPTALQAAVSDENEEMVEFLLDAGTSVNEMPADEPFGTHMPRTALQAAVDTGNMEIMRILVDRGARINAPAARDSGATALQLACIHGYLTIILRLLELGADVNARGALKNGRTALEGAAEHGRIDTIQLLLNSCVCTDGPYREQYVKAILYAEKNLHFAAAALLKEHREWSAEDEECYKNLRSGGLDKE